MGVLNEKRCKKFKKRFLDFLWMKIREPKIRKKYHPDFILNMVYETDAMF